MDESSPVNIFNAKNKEAGDIRTALFKLREQHRKLDEQIQDVIGASGAMLNQLTLQRLKRHKLSIKDRISFLEKQLTPDIIA